MKIKQDNDFSAESVQEEIAVMFRKGELQRRQARREKLLANEAALADEMLNAEEQAAHDKAIARIKENHLAMAKEMSPGYWLRLWRALLNR